MLTSLLRLLRRRTPLCARRHAPASPKRRAFRPGMEHLETRTMPYAAVSLLPLLTAPPVGEFAAAAAGANRLAPHEDGPGFFAAVRFGSVDDNVEGAVRVVTFSTGVRDVDVATVATEPVAPAGSSATEAPTITFSLNSLGATGSTGVLPLVGVEATDAGAPEALDTASGVATTPTLTFRAAAATDSAFAAEFTTDALESAAAGEATAVALQVDVPPEVDAGVPVDVMIIALADAVRPATSYSGTVQLTSSDAAVAPTVLAFRPADNGIRVFEVLFQHPGNQTLMVADAANRLRETVKVVVRRSAARRRGKPRDVLDIWMRS